MRVSIIVAAGLALALSASGAQAGWSGCRIGVQGGVVDAAASLTKNPGSVQALLKPKAASVTGGVEAGCDFGLPLMVVGFGASYDFMNATQRKSSTVATGVAPFQTTRSVTVDSHSRGIAALSGRAGFDIGPILLFGRVGFAMAPQTSHYNLTIATPFTGTTSTDLAASQWRAGPLLGLGAEMQLGATVVKLEYDYYEFGTRNALMKGLYNAPMFGKLPVSLPMGNKFTVGALRAGVAYRF